VTADYSGVVIGGLIGFGSSTGLWLIQRSIAGGKVRQQLAILLKDAAFVFNSVKTHASGRLIPDLLEDPVALLKERGLSSDAAAALNRRQAELLNFAILRASRYATLIVKENEELYSSGGRNTVSLIEEQAGLAVEALNQARTALGDTSPLEGTTG
jgi:hypothetical protein